MANRTPEQWADRLVDAVLSTPPTDAGRIQSALAEIVAAAMAQARAEALREASDAELTAALTRLRAIAGDGQGVGK